MSEVKKTMVKVNEEGEFLDIAPVTYADIVYSNDQGNGTVRSELNDLMSNLTATTATANAAAVLVVSPTAPVAPATNIIWVKP